MYLDSKGIIVDKNTGKFYEFLQNIGVKQGDGASPELFLLFFDRIYPYLLQYYTTRNIHGKRRYDYTIASL